MKNFLFVFCFLLGIVSVCQSCKKESFLARPSLLAADSLMWTRPDSSLRLLEQMASPEKLKGADRALYALLLTQARYKNCVLLKNDSLIRIAVRYYEKSKDKERLAESYFYLGCIHGEHEKVTEAIEFYLKAIDTMPQTTDSLFLSMVYSHLGDCYNKQTLSHTAISMYKKGYSLCINRDSVRACYALKDIGDAFLVKSQLDSADYYYQEALEVANHLQHMNLAVFILKNMAALYNEQKRYAEAGSCISKVLPHLANKEDYTSACSTKGDIMSNLGQNDSAIYYWNIGKESSDIYVKTSDYYSLYQANKEKGYLKKAVSYVDSFIVFYDSIHSMNDRAELDKLMDNHLLELHKYKLSVKNKQVIGGMILVFLFLILLLSVVYLWRDSYRKKKYMLLQQRLMENRAEIMLLNEIPESVLESKSAELYQLEEERFHICISLFKTTEGYKKLCELTKATTRMRMNIVHSYRKTIITDIRNTFADVMGDLKDHFITLTNDDLLYCMLSLLHCPKDIIPDVMDVSADAIKTRKNRIKHKIDAYLFNRIFDYK